jgi:hypothetical protein
MSAGLSGLHPWSPPLDAELERTRRPGRATGLDGGRFPVAGRVLVADGRGQPVLCDLNPATSVAVLPGLLGAHILHGPTSGDPRCVRCPNIRRDPAANAHLNPDPRNPRVRGPVVRCDLVRARRPPGWGRLMDLLRPRRASAWHSLAWPRQPGGTPRQARSKRRQWSSLGGAGGKVTGVWRCRSPSAACARSVRRGGASPRVR